MTVDLFDQPPVFRTAGLTVRQVDELAFLRTFTMATELTRDGEWLRQQGERLAEELYPVIGTTTGDDRHRLVGLRRALHQGRPPKRADWTTTVAKLTGERLAADIDLWVGRRRQHDKLAAELPGVLQAELDEKNAIVRRLAQDPGFQRALSQASPTLNAELTKWLATSGRAAPRQRSVNRLAKYLIRAATKTSPFSTFTISGAGSWADGQPGISYPAEGMPAVRGVLELNTALVDSAVAAVCADPESRPSLRLRVNPSLVIHGENVIAIGHRVTEAIFMVPATRSLLACLELVEEHGPTRSELREKLVAINPTSTRAIDDFIDHLVQSEIVEYIRPVADQDPDPVVALSRWIESSQASGTMRHVAADLREVGDCLAQDVPVGDLAGHAGRIRRLTGRLDALRDGRLGVADYGVGAGKFGFHENAMYTEAAATCSRERWRGALNDLDAVRRWIAPFDASLPARLVLGAYVRERFGSGSRTPFMVACKAIHENASGQRCARTTSYDAELWRLFPVGTVETAAASGLTASRVPRIVELSRIQDDARRLLDDAPHGADGIAADPRSIRALAERWPAWVQPLRSICFYAQPYESDAGNVRLVVNLAHVGYGRGRSRLQLLSGRPSEPDDRWGAGPPDSVDRPYPAEFSGLFGASFNRRSPGAPLEIAYPGTTTNRPAEQQVRIGDLLVVHDPGTDLAHLVSGRLGCRIEPVHLGMLMEELLPPTARLLVRAFGSSNYASPAMYTYTRETARPGPSADAIVSIPRIAVGRVVIRRAALVVATSHVPVRANGWSDAEHYLAMTQWRRDNAIPRAVFVRTFDGPKDSDGDPTEAWARRVFSTSHKPQYIDFSSYYSMSHFERIVTSAGPFLVMEEVLPALGGAVGPERHDPRVVEFLVEISEQRAASSEAPR